MNLGGTSEFHKIMAKVLFCGLALLLDNLRDRMIDGMQELQLSRVNT